MRTVSGSSYIIPDAVHDKFIEWEVHVPLTYILNRQVLFLAAICTILISQFPCHHWWTSYHKVKIPLNSWQAQHDLQWVASSLAMAFEAYWSIPPRWVVPMADALHINHGQRDVRWRLAALASLWHWSPLSLSNIFPWPFSIPGEVI